MRNVLFCILAAGKGTRTKWDLPKPLLPISGKTLLDRVISVSEEAGKSFENSEVVLILGHGHQKVREYLGKRTFKTVLQEPQLGTGHALMKVYEQLDKSFLKNFDYIVVTCADTPLITKQVYEELALKIEKENLEGVVTTTRMEDPTGYGRVILEKGKFSIIEHKDCTPLQLKETTINTGCYIFKKDALEKALGQITNKNKASEYYLTDAFNLLKTNGHLGFSDPGQFLGVNTLVQLHEASVLLRERVIHDLMLAGVLFEDVKSTIVEPEVKIGRQTIIGSNVILKGQTMIGESCTIQAGSIVTDSQIGNNVTILPYTLVESSKIEDLAQVGPFARIRPDTVIGEKSKVGNFVELKKTVLHKDVKVSHLSYVGDAEIGESSNIGCGFITCNYDGEKKHKTTIGKGCFIGSDTQMVAPVTLGDSCYVASGSTINQDMEDFTFAISRGRQVNKPGLAKKFIKVKKK